MRPIVGTVLGIGGWSWAILVAWLSGVLVVVGALALVYRLS